MTEGSEPAINTKANRIRKPRGKIAHSTRGRVRLKLQGASPAELQRIGARVRSLPHVHDVEVHSRTGSIVVHHDPGDKGIAADLVDLAWHSALFSLELSDDPVDASAQLTDVEHDATYLADHSRAGKVIIRYAEHLNRAAKQATDGWVDLRVLLPATAGVCALIFVEIESAPLWLPLALFSFQSFSSLHQPHPTTEGEAARTRTLTAGEPSAAGPAKQALAKATEPPAPRPKRPARKKAGA